MMVCVLSRLMSYSKTHTGVKIRFVDQRKRSKSLKTNGFEPYAYLKHLFTELPKAKPSTISKPYCPIALMLTG